MFKPLFKTRAQIELSIMESEANGENIIRTKIKRSILALGPQKRVSGYNRNKAEKWVGIIAPLMAIFFFGLFAGPIGFSHISRNKKTKKWPFVKGSVIRSFLNSKRIARRFRGGAVYVPEITYVYKVDNMEYKNNTIYFFKGHSNIYNIEATYVEKYWEGTSVDVYYNPKDPAESVLETGRLSRFSLISFISGCFSFLVICIALILFILVQVL